MGWEKYSSDLKIVLITNSFEDKLLSDHKKVHAKNCLSKCRILWPTVKRMTTFSAVKHFVRDFNIQLVFCWGQHRECVFYAKIT